MEMDWMDVMNNPECNIDCTSDDCNFGVMCIINKCTSECTSAVECS